MKPLNSIQGDKLNEWLVQAKKQIHLGQLPNYIPLLGQADPNELAFYLLTQDNYCVAVGNMAKTFSLMSVSKVFSLLYLLSLYGEEFVLKRVGTKASEYPFNSLTQLQLDQGLPRNPMINSGAITLAGLLPGKKSNDCCNNLRIWLNECSGSNLFLDENMLDSVRSLPNPKNIALAEELHKSGYLENLEIALDTYQQICCLSGNIIDLAKLGMLLINSPLISSQNRQIVHEILRECGLYEESQTLAFNQEFPTKSGVSGAMLSIVPQQGIIACYSPPLNDHGNSVAGLFLIEKIADFLN
ncbi:glutaminase A [Aphanothece hegewaldii CCALA 016]|uniref:glutaminase n=1 Tax=Aphanothece hegewaldii CCALA 016 TaxID=2107694 RepID=A0A2T1LSQ2_9CHRO|nr:glutaminase [Aphanothece hegewaldii]PSF32946.1 glutaminase A [Aphanothece hegewaldii CCALA 016]